MSNEKFMNKAIELSIENVRPENGGPFGAVVVKDGKIIDRGVIQLHCIMIPQATLRRMLFVMHATF